MRQRSRKYERCWTSLTNSESDAAAFCDKLLQVRFQKFIQRFEHHYAIVLVVQIMGAVRNFNVFNVEIRLPGEVVEFT